MDHIKDTTSKFQLYDFWLCILHVESTTFEFQIWIFYGILASKRSKVPDSIFYLQVPL